jgi:H+/Cl- antiporter ClcA
VPAGIFGPAFSIGSGFGRLIGELVVGITFEFCGKNALRKELVEFSGDNLSKWSA